MEAVQVDFLYDCGKIQGNTSVDSQKDDWRFVVIAITDVKVLDG